MLFCVSGVDNPCLFLTGSDNPCIWELVHTKSEVEGRPETVFQLCSR